ncbi:MAG: hypothetical protein K6E12_11430 [Saccharofermentans sp.]|nr:hypothetical protein [Saccharofermentans sp.]
MRSILIKDTTREEREAIVRASLDCGGGCEYCSSCWLGGIPIRSSSDTH